ncbi:hypothetical protein JHK82_015678 [Glycine max]|nr:hypothetical protein JHK85_016070 [Glycine max]KAG5046300.1 hypothetical protein JHK86_015706 [Glycine max]KAG5148797.1 hypothetical protein JHK82_015678 [Glycine max]
MDSSPSPDINIPEQWLEATESIANSSMPPITLICGAKNCAKTTFSRYLLNVLLNKYTKVAYLDTDVGQPEFTPPAFLSLTIVHKVTSVKISISSEKKNLPAGEFWSDGEHDETINLIEINSAHQDSLTRSVLVQIDARLLRDLRILTYFKQCFSSDSNISTIKELAHALASHCPYEVPIASIKIQHLHCEVPSSEIFYSLNATVVGLAVDSHGPENLPWCLGLGIVRGIDTVKGVLYVITPVPHSSLERVNLLLQGYIQIPSCLLQARNFLHSFTFSLT